MKTESVGAGGPLLQDYILHEKMAHFNRERPERVYTRFRRFWDIYRNARHQAIYYKAKMFPGKVKKPVLSRFSTVGGERICETERS
jgi:catalase